MGNACPMQSGTRDSQPSDSPRQSGEHALWLSCDNAGTEKGQTSADLVGWGGNSFALFAKCFISASEIDSVPQEETSEGEKGFFF